MRRASRKKSQETIDLSTTCPYCLGHKVKAIGCWETFGKQMGVNPEHARKDTR